MVFEQCKTIVWPTAIIIVAVVLLIYYRLLKRILDTSDIELPWLKIKKREPKQPLLEESNIKTEDLKRKDVKRLLQEWETRFPGCQNSMFGALSNILPSHLLDRQLHDFRLSTPEDEDSCQQPSSQAPSKPLMTIQPDPPR